MFDIGVWELALIGVITLIVVGPERLPRLARTGGLWFGKARRFISSVKADIDKELRAEELKRIMQEQARSSGLHEILEETRSTMENTRADLEQARTRLEATGGEAEPAAEPSSPQPPSLENDSPVEPDAPARPEDRHER